MNLPQFLNLIDSRTSQMTKEELAASIHQIARVLPAEHRNWLLTLIDCGAEEAIAAESEASDDLHEQLNKIMLGEKRLDSDLNEEWDAERCAIGSEALSAIDIMFTVRSSIALQTAESALRLGDTAFAGYCYTEAFRSDSTAVNYLRALLNSPDYKAALSELQTIASGFHEQDAESCQKKNALHDDTRRLIRFLNGEFLLGLKKSIL